MNPKGDTRRTLKAWASIPDLIIASLERLDEEHLDLRLEDGEWSIRETVHHLVEAQVVASSIVIAALGSPGCTYDWSWMQPSAAWMKRLRYGVTPVDASLDAVQALCKYVVALVAPLQDGLQREVNLRDSPSADLRPMSVADVLRQEVAHTHEHVAQIRAVRRMHGL